ncbi:hypothetical protein [Neisseria sp. 74A18]|uniref:hypothetical protein n=1 Tax=Neisseria sp. 74A18 TaxID=1696094 RepID=UPI000B1EF060|nr:hypothetical protein [Neisseria sp. 74A18]
MRPSESELCELRKAGLGAKFFQAANRFRRGGLHIRPYGFLGYEYLGMAADLCQGLRPSETRLAVFQTASNNSND